MQNNNEHTVNKDRQPCHVAAENIDPSLRSSTSDITGSQTSMISNEPDTDMEERGQDIPHANHGDNTPPTDNYNQQPILEPEFGDQWQNESQDMYSGSGHSTTDNTWIGEPSADQYQQGLQAYDPNQFTHTPQDHPFYQGHRQLAPSAEFVSYGSMDASGGQFASVDMTPRGETSGMFFSNVVVVHCLTVWRRI